MAKLYFRYGTVGSAKTLNLIAVAHNYVQQVCWKILPPTHTHSTTHLYPLWCIISPSLQYGVVNDVGFPGVITTTYLFSFRYHSNQYQYAFKPIVPFIWCEHLYGEIDFDLV